MFEIMALFFMIYCRNYYKHLNNDLMVMFFSLFLNESWKAYGQCTNAVTAVCKQSKDITKNLKLKTKTGKIPKIPRNKMS